MHDKTRETTDTVISMLRNAGLVAYPASELEYSYYHSHGRDVPKVGEITDVKELSRYSAKPVQALWLSQGEVQPDNTVDTAWLQYVNKYLSTSKFFQHATDGLLHCVLDNNAVILEITCSEDIGMFQDFDALVWKSRFSGGTYEDVREYQDDDGNWCEEWFEVNVSRDDVISDALYYCDIDYARLREIGVDAIRVRGEEFADNEQSALYGWDIDSLAILRGDCVVRMTPVEAKQY